MPSTTCEHCGMEIRDITKALEAGIPLDDKYRFALFDSNRELELVWDGKSHEVTNIVLETIQGQMPQSSDDRIQCY